MQIRCVNCFGEYDDALGLCPLCGYEAGDAPKDVFCLLPGTVIADRYIIGGKVSSGGFGIVYKAWDKKLETVVAVKEYYPSGLVNRLPGEADVILVATKREREFVYGKTRFLEEARNMAKFNSHKNIVNVYQFFEENNTAYIVMEYLSGRTLSEILQQQNVPLPYDYCVNVAKEICAALGAIHKENILHRDVSPDNIMICNDGTIKLFDFGAARFSAGVENRVTVVVKPGFAPAEQYDKVNRQDARTDLYALGATLYYAMTGVKPDESTNRKIEDTVVEPSAIDSNIPEYISTAIMRAMAVEQHYRFANVEEFEKALLGEKNILSVQKEKERKRRFRALGIVASLLLVFFAAGTFLHMYNAEKNDVILQDAELEVWYIKTGVTEVDNAKAAALDSITATFTQEYSNVAIALTPIEKSGYAAALAKAVEDKNTPAIFESTGIETLPESVADLGEILHELPEKAYYNAALGDKAVYPTGIVVPIIYVNTSLGSVEEISDLASLVELCKQQQQYFVVKQSTGKMYADLYGEDIAGYVLKSALTEFASRQAFIYLGDSSDYSSIQKALPGEYEVIMPSVGNSAYDFGTIWSVCTQDEAAKKAALTLLEYFNSDIAQDYFHIQNRSGCLPIVKTSLEKYIGVYDELNSVGDFMALAVAVGNTSSDLPVGTDNSKLKELKTAADRVAEFADVADSAWYAEAVAAVYAQGLMDGIENEDMTQIGFLPNEPVSRSDVVISLYRLAGSPAVSGVCPFTNIIPKSELGRAATWGIEKGIVTQSADGLFADENVSLETAMIFFLRFAQVEGLGTDANYDLSVFKDSASVGSWAVEGIKWGLAHDILSIDAGGVIEPKQDLSRGRYAMFLQRLSDMCTANSLTA